MKVGEEKVPHFESHAVGDYKPVSFRSRRGDTAVVNALNERSHVPSDNFFDVLRGREGVCHDSDFPG